MKNRMRKLMAGWAAALMLASAGSLVAHHSLSKFDTTTGVTVSGTVVVFERVNPHSFIFLDEKGKGGEMRRWAIEGPSIIQLTRMGIEKDTLKAGDAIEACGYVMKEGVQSQRTVSTEPISSSLKDQTPKSVSGQVLTAELLVMPDGKKQKWSDYGHHKCLAPDFKDSHSR
jgi:Family of unknown function (DUF6152)